VTLLFQTPVGLIVLAHVRRLAWRGGGHLGDKMGGRRRDFDGTFSQENIRFWQTDPRIRGSKSTVKVFVLYAGQVAVQERRECLPMQWDHKAIGNLCDLDPKTSARALNSAKENSLIGVAPDGRLIVWGTAKRHRNLPFKNTCINGVMQEHKIPLQYEEALYKSREEEIRVEESRELQKEPAAQKAGPRLSETDPPHFNVDGALCGKMRAGWKLRFGAIQHPRMDHLLARCRTREISPIRVFDYAKEHQPDDPLKYVQSLLRDGDGLWPDDSDQSCAQWEAEASGATEKKPTRSSKPTRIGELL